MSLETFPPLVLLSTRYMLSGSITLLFALAKRLPPAARARTGGGLF